MKRRDFVRNSLAASISASLPRVAFLANATSGSDTESESQFLTAQMIWLSESVPVPLKQNGHAGEISASTDEHLRVATPDLHAVFAREFEIRALPAKATIRLFAYTRYRLYINGVYMGRGPSRFQNQRPEYDTREIASALHTGRNLIVVLVHRDSPTGRIMRHEPGFAAVIHFGDGTTGQLIPTDTTWLSRPELSFGARDEAWSSIRENLDARKGLDLTQRDLSLTGWPSSVLVEGPSFFPVWPRTTPLQSETPRLWSKSPVCTRHSPILLASSQEASFDLPEIIQGYHNLRFDAEEGTEMEVAYLLPQETDSGLSTYIARQGEQNWMGGDTFAFKRLTIRVKSGDVRIFAAQAVEVRYPFERAASFESSDVFLNQLWKICARSTELLSEDSWVDCADRERVEWTDNTPPAFDCTRVMMRGPAADGKEYWGDNRLLKALLRRIALTQQSDGQLKAHSCSERFDIHAIMEDRSCDWIILMRQYVESCGDLELIHELWPTLTRLMQWFLDRRTSRGLVLAREWEVWDNPLRYQVCEGAGLNAFAYRALSEAAWLAEQIGELSAGKAFAKDAERLKSDFNGALWNSEEGSYDGGIFGPGSRTAEQLNGRMFTGPFVNGRYHPTVQAALVALYCDIVPTDRVPPVRNFILAHLSDVQRPMSHFYLFHALFQMEGQQYDHMAIRIMRAGWKNQVESPWQTTWEDLVDAGGSKAHIYGIIPGFFLTAYVLGARRAGPVTDRSILIEPRCADLSWAHGVAVTEFGPIEVEWSISMDGVLVMQCSIPPNTTATLRLYKRGDQDFISIDGQRIQITLRGNFVEEPLTHGKHTIHYPG